MKLHEYLKYHRERQHLTQEQLAEKLYVSRQAVSKWERGEAMPEIENIVRLSDIYNVSIDELLRGGKFLEKPFIIGGVHVWLSIISFVLMAAFLGFLISGTGYPWIGLVPFVILIGIGLVSFRPEKIVVEKNHIEVYKYKNWIARIKSLFTSSGTKYVYPYSEVKALIIRYYVRNRISPMDLGPDMFKGFFLLENGEEFEFDLDYRISHSLPVLSDFLILKDVKIIDKQGIIEMIATDQNIFEGVRKTKDKNQ